ncbi:MAG TPA: NADH-quinone oxidoreductase subunit J [Phycisphaerales bacterium]|nr:NADH-quinone oxidoreductase subunit J [Phycisphaerales bacterium]
MNQIINPTVFFVLLVLGAAGVCLALPRRGRTPQIVGGLVAGLAAGLLMLALGLKAGREHLPNVYFYIFSLVGLAAALRVITHPRPVYAALYFILTVIASAGLFLLLSAEFMAFALIIVYAGAILITYLFVIMLATQAPEEGQEEVLAEYDTQAREPIAATMAGFLVLAALTAMAFRGLPNVPAPAVANPDAMLASVPRKVDRVLRNHGLLESGQSADLSRVAEGVVVLPGGKELPRPEWPEQLRMTNGELLGFNLLRDHPGTIEIAGVILLMAMLGAVVLSRKQVQLDEEAKSRRVTQLAEADAAGDPAVDSPLGLTQQPAHTGGGGV